MAKGAARGAKKAALIALRVLGGIVAAAAIFIGGTLLVLRTDWGGERLRRQVVSRANQQIQGTLGIERLSFGGDNLQVWGVTLRDPDGAMVARLARAEVGFSPLRVLRKEIRVTTVVLETPIVTVVSGADGSNLARATEPRAPQKKAPAKQRKQPVDRHGPDGWIVRLDRFELTNGSISTAVAADEADGAPTPKVQISNLGVFASARIATGNGATDLTVRLSGQSEHTPVGPFRLAANVGVHGDERRFDADGELLGGTLKLHGKVDARQVENADVLVAVAIPRQELAGHTWGPVRIHARAEPSKSLDLDALVKLPGVELTAKDRGPDEPGVRGRLTVSDLAATGKAIAALSGGDTPPLGGRGEVSFGIEKATGAGDRFEGQTSGEFERLRFGDTAIARMTFDGRSARLSRTPGTASFDLHIASVSSGTTDVRGIDLAARARERDVKVTLAVASPAKVDVGLDGRFSEDRHAFDVTALALAFPGARWVSDGVARFRSDDDEVSLSKLRLTSEGQVLAVDAARRGDDLSAHVALTDLRLDRLPTALIDPKLRLGGVLNVDVQASGRTDAPKVAARVDLKQAAYQGLSKIDAKLSARLENDRVGGKMNVDAPFLTATGDFALPAAPAPGAPVDVKLDVERLDIGELMRAAERPALADGRLNMKLRAEGSADDPKVTLTMEAVGLQVKKPPAGAKAGRPEKPVDVGKARVRLSYEDRSARAEVDFTSSHGGTLVVDANTRVDLSYPRVTRPIVAAKLPIRGKLVARNLDVAWVAQLNPRLESMAGRVTADARLGGTVADPQVLGEVRWKNGKLIATPPPAQQPGAAKRPTPGGPQGRPSPSTR